MIHGAHKDVDVTFWKYSMIDFERRKEKARERGIERGREEKNDDFYDGNKSGKCATTMKWMNNDHELHKWFLSGIFSANNTNAL